MHSQIVPYNCKYSTFHYQGMAALPASDPLLSSLYLQLPCLIISGLLLFTDQLVQMEKSLQNNIKFVFMQEIL